MTPKQAPRTDLCSGCLPMVACLHIGRSVPCVLPMMPIQKGIKSIFFHNAPYVTLVVMTLSMEIIAACCHAQLFNG